MSDIGKLARTVSIEIDGRRLNVHKFTAGMLAQFSREMKRIRWERMQTDLKGLLSGDDWAKLRMDIEEHDEVAEMATPDGLQLALYLALKPTESLTLEEVGDLMTMDDISRFSEFMTTELLPGGDDSKNPTAVVETTPG